MGEDYEGNAINANHAGMYLRARDAVVTTWGNHYGGSIAMSAKRMRRLLMRRNTVAVGYRGKSIPLRPNNLPLKVGKPS